MQALAHYGYDIHPQGYGEYFLTGANGFGAVPMDTTTVAAEMLLQELDLGGTGSTTLGALDQATRQNTCQRAQDLLNLPVCAAGADPTTGACIDPSQFQNPVATLKSKLSTACAAYGVSTGMSKTTMALLAVGGVAILYFLLRKKK